jgi:hypothetical protein
MGDTTREARLAAFSSFDFPPKNFLNLLGGEAVLSFLRDDSGSSRTGRFSGVRGFDVSGVRGISCGFDAATGAATAVVTAATVGGIYGEIFTSSLPSTLATSTFEPSGEGLELPLTGEGPLEIPLEPSVKV